MNPTNLKLEDMANMSNMLTLILAFKQHQLKSSLILF